jgi:transcriptional regulator with XRE-family HTH domain
MDHPGNPDAAHSAFRSWREARGLSRRDAAAWLGIKRRTLERLEQGNSPDSPLWGLLMRVVELAPPPNDTDAQ